ncbi:DUF938 domain-containing protein [Acidisphaera sp. L21]|uniref:DUF938 domain-containing protein n=1 Tax=Acidisphaera sp. L21 TaxID=1641851 RepID=UPI00131D9DFE|nr:DUF938 domain-containing protein [Acidisphaera sp. L21]
MSDSARLSAPSALRNREPILDALRPHLPTTGLVLEVASGTGEHVAHFGAALPSLDWQPTDLGSERRASVDSWASDLPNIRPAIELDATAPNWPVGHADAVLCINMVHIAPWVATQGLVAGAARILPPGGLLALYGPYRRAGQAMEPGNAAFDADLRQRNPGWGLRLLEDVAAVSSAAGFGPPGVTPMPSNNLLLVFRRL